MAATFLPLVIAFALAVTRIAGFLVASPFPGQHLGTSARMALLVALSLVGALGVSSPLAPTTASAALVPAALGELVLGALIGYAFYLCLAAADVLGHALSLATGLSMPSVLNPATSASESALSRAVTLIALAVALAAGVHRTAIGMLLASFRAVPIGSPLSLHAAMPAVTEMAGQAFSVGLRLAMPVMGVTLVVQMSLAMIARAAPALQIFSVGLSVLVATGLVVLTHALGDIGHALAEHVAATGPWIDRLLSALAG